MNEETERLPFDVRAVAIDETEYWNLDPEIEPYVERVSTIYIYDKNTHVHICSFTPNYELYPVDRQITLKNIDFDAPDEAGYDLRERVLTWFDETPMEWGVDYYVTSDVDRIEANPGKYQYEVVGTYPRPETREQEWEALRELAGEYNSNGVLA